MGWSCTDREIDAIDRAPKTVWQNGIDQDGSLLDDTWVADITGLLDLTEWTQKIPGLRIIARDEPSPNYGASVLFDDIEDVVARLRAHGAELVGELEPYEDIYRLCYIRGPEGIVVGLAEQLS